MLLPSDVARLVLGYLQEEGLSSTSQAFIHESPNLKEYADHTTEDGTIPACVFSVFGKGLTTILNEYVAAKTKESCPEVPAMMTSLWKKLDFTLNQIRSLQNSPAISASQRTRSRIGLANMARQRVLTVASAGGVVCSSVSETSSILSPAHTSHSMLGHSTPMSYTAPHSQPQTQDVSRLLATPRDSPVQIIVSEHRLNPGPLSPGRRKWDTPRKRGGATSGSSGPGRCAMTASSFSAEPQPEEAVDGNFPQLVIQNARDKILGDRSLQEKLAENINKILASDPMPQTTKASSSTMEEDQSIDEILGLQGEIHMSDDAIHDILEQTESDPAFQALYDLFDYNKTRFTDGEPGDGDISSSPEESDTAGPSSAVKPFQSGSLGTQHTDASDTTPLTVKMKAGQERKTRKSTAPTVLKKTGPSGKASRIENSSARMLVSHGEHRDVSSAAVDSNRKAKESLSNNSVFVTPMDVDEPLNTPPPPSDSIATQELVTKDSTSTTAALSESTTVPSSGAPAAIAAPEQASAYNVDQIQEHEQAQGSREQPATAPSPSLSNQLAFLSPLQVELNNTPASNADLPHILISSSGDTQPVCTLSVSPEAASSTSASTAAPFTAISGSPTSASTSATLTATPASSTPASPASSSSCVPGLEAPDPPSTKHAAPSKAEADSNIVSLKIIISDNQDDNSSSDTASDQAISSISGNKIPTIYLSSPAKSLGSSGTPKANLDEVAQAVSGLQSSEAHTSPSSKAVVASPFIGTSQPQQNYIIQLPLDTTNPALQGATASYFIVTEPPTADAQTRQLLLPAGVSKGPLPPNQYGMTTPTRSQGFSTGPALILPSPVKPLMLPVSVMGQNTLGNVQMVSNQLVAIPNPVPVQKSEAVKPRSSTVAIKRSTTAGTEQHLFGKLVQPLSAENTSQQDAAKVPRHRRILCFDSSAEVKQQIAKTTRTAKPPATNTSTSQSVQQTEKDNTQSVTRTKPTILGGNKPKRRVQPIRCSADPQTGGGFVKEAEKSTPPQQHQKEPVKKDSRKQDHNIHNQECQSASTSRVDASKPETLKKPESVRRSRSIDRKQSHDKEGEGAKAKDSHGPRSLSSDSTLNSVSRNEKEESSSKELAEKAPAKSREGRTEKRTPSQEVPNVTANKENEMKGSTQEQQQQSTPSSSTTRDFSPPAVTQPTSNPHSKATKAPSKTSSLAKQAAEMLHDIQGLNSASTPVKRPRACSTDLSLPRTPGTGRNQEELAECPKTPSRQKKGKDGEGTPKHLLPPTTPDVPTCSPASEAGSENSINMAAHTLMILSRAAIARTGTPLKDSLRQEGVGEKSPTSSKNSKKRKQSSPTTSPPAKKDRLYSTYNYHNPTSTDITNS
ncbi:protein NPAT isoform X2 [Micropterus dolomieu]|uniref:protein NPAT isoform X2 n=1 Tax=Micropterus dolomieu TaxID=147949 RepID=UPI001E8D0E69|nr:protein NPAT isoform X2 [Micropterus dolomieu]